MSSSSKTIPIVSATDEHYAPYLSVMMTTLLENIGPKKRVRFYIIDDDVSLSSKAKLRKMVEESSNEAEIEFVSIDKEIYKDFLVSDHITLTSYYRISLPQFLKKEGYQKIIYVDADTFILDDISKIYETSLNGKTIGAVIDQRAALRLPCLGIPSTNFYFNAGFLFIDLKRWDKNKITDKTIKFLTDHGDKITYHDQDALNAVLYEDWHPLHPRWNRQLFLTLEDCPAPNEAYDRLYKEGRENPSIVHFTGRDKPWNTPIMNPYQIKYLEKLKKWEQLKEMNKS